MNRVNTPSPVLVLLPGLDGTGKLFAEFLKALDSSIGTLVVTYPKDVPMNYDQLEALVTAALPTDRPFVLLGESFSGPLAIRIAARRPEFLVGLVLCVTFARNPYSWAALGAAAGQILAAQVPASVGARASDVGIRLAESSAATIGAGDDRRIGRGGSAADCLTARRG